MTREVPKISADIPHWELTNWHLTRLSPAQRKELIERYQRQHDEAKRSRDPWADLRRQELEFAISRLRREASSVDVDPPFDIPAKSTNASSTVEGRIAKRRELLDVYKRATGTTSDKAIYEADSCPIYKPQFYEWRNGKLRDGSHMVVSFERFLRERKPPSPRASTKPRRGPGISEP